MIKASEITETAVNLLHGCFAGGAAEKLYLICFDRSGNPSKPLCVAAGCETAVCAYAHDVVREALKQNARAAVIAHNHPYGAAKPSLQDVCFTKKTAALMASAGIMLADHIVFSGDERFSFAASRLYSGALSQTGLRL